MSIRHKELRSPRPLENGTFAGYGNRRCEVENRNATGPSLAKRPAILSAGAPNDSSALLVMALSLPTPVQSDNECFIVVVGSSSRRLNRQVCVFRYLKQMLFYN